LETATKIEGGQVSESYLSVDAEEFARALARVCRVSPVSTRTIHEALTHVLVEPDLDGLRLVCTDLDLWAQATVPAAMSRDSGNFTVPARLLRSILRGAKGELVIAAEGNTAQFSYGERRARLGTGDASKFPKTNQQVEERYDMPGLVGMLSLVTPAASDDPSRPFLCSVLFEPERLVATDTHRLHMVEHNCDLTGWPERGVIVPISILGSLRMVLGAGTDSVIGVGLSASEYDVATGIEFRLGNVSLATRLNPDLGYPNYRSKRILPDVYPCEHEWLIGAHELLAACAFLTPLAAGDRGRVSIEHILPGELRLAAESDMGSASVIIPLDAAGTSGEPGYRIGMSARYLADAVRMTCSQSVRIRLGKPTNPVYVTPAESDTPLAVVMPMQHKAVE